MPHQILSSIVLVLLLVVASACSGPREASTPDVPGPDEREARKYALSEFEDFDPRPYSDVALEQSRTVEHDVPQQLLDGRVEEQSMKTVDGYRIQIFSSQNKREADQRANDVIAWWNASRDDSEFEASYPGNTAQPPVYIVFRQPYYRVRLGNFAERKEALAFTQIVAKRFPDAFVLPDRVTVMQ